MLRPLPLLAVIGLPLLILAAVLYTSHGVFGGYGGEGKVMRVMLARDLATVELPDVRGDENLPLIVIDPGHGGFDPGASARGYVEKALVLQLAIALRDEIERQGIARVALTREDDRYLLHEERYRIAQRLDADLFLSLHADSAGARDEVTGASIYTLSEEASSRAAALFAQRENASDTIGGVDLASQSATVSDILVELSQRRTQEQSAEFAALIEREGAGILDFHPQARRAAWLAVLRAPDIPSVLFESGFISNEEDARRLSSPEGREGFAQVMARAIRIYFLRRDAS